VGAKGGGLPRGGMGGPAGSVEYSPGRKASMDARRKAQEKRWAARSGPVCVRLVSDPEPTHTPDSVNVPVDPGSVGCPEQRPLTVAASRCHPSIVTEVAAPIPAEVMAAILMVYRRPWTRWAKVTVVPLTVTVVGPVTRYPVIAAVPWEAGAVQ
jgi:hypothetical protein